MGVGRYASITGWGGEGELAPHYRASSFHDPSGLLAQKNDNSVKLQVSTQATDTYTQ